MDISLWIYQPSSPPWCYLFLHPHISTSFSPLPASFSSLSVSRAQSRPNLFHACFKITGRMWGFIDFWSRGMTSLGSDPPVYIWFTARHLWPQRKCGSRGKTTSVWRLCYTVILPCCMYRHLYSMCTVVEVCVCKSARGSPLWHTAELPGQIPTNAKTVEGESQWH